VVVVCCGCVIIAISGGFFVAGLLSGRPEWPLVISVVVGAYLLIRGVAFLRRAFHREPGLTRPPAQPRRPQ